jgi:Nuclear transport factor 2 (NTF2) domain
MIIENIIEPVIYEYYLRLNSGDFKGVSKLFSKNGLLHPPFERELCGREAIAQYLQAEAKGLEAFPKLGTVINKSDRSNLYKIQGYVKTSFFTVNVCWLIELDDNQEIVSVEVQLLAQLQDLLALKPGLKTNLVNV